MRREREQALACVKVRDFAQCGTGIRLLAYESLRIPLFLPFAPKTGHSSVRWNDHEVLQALWGDVYDEIAHPEALRRVPGGGGLWEAAEGQRPSEGTSGSQAGTVARVIDARHGFGRDELAILRRLKTPQRIQFFLDSEIGYNKELQGARVARRAGFCGAGWRIASKARYSAP
jgi:hypothetical protein